MKILVIVQVFMFSNCAINMYSKGTTFSVAAFWILNESTIPSITVGRCYCTGKWISLEEV